MGENEIRSLSDRRWGLKNLRLQPVPSIVEIEQRQLERKLQLMLQLMVERGRKEARKMLQLQAAGLPRATSQIESIRRVAEVKPEEIIEQSEKANNGKRDYAYAFGVLSEMMKHISWLATLEKH